MEQRLHLYQKGYEQRHARLSQQWAQLWEDLTRGIVDRACFDELKQDEALAVPRRLWDVRETSDVVEQREQELQQQHQELQAVKTKLRGVVDVKSSSL